MRPWESVRPAGGGSGQRACRWWIEKSGVRSANRKHRQLVGCVWLPCRQDRCHSGSAHRGATGQASIAYDRNLINRPEGPPDPGSKIGSKHFLWLARGLLRPPEHTAAAWSTCFRLLPAGSLERAGLPGRDAGGGPGEHSEGQGTRQRSEPAHIACNVCQPSRGARALTHFWAARTRRARWPGRRAGLRSARTARRGRGTGRAAEGRGRPS